VATLSAAITLPAPIFFDDHRSTSPLAEFGRDHSSDQVDAAAGSGTADQPDRGLRLGLRTGHDGRLQSDLASGFRHPEKSPPRYDVEGILLARPFKVVRVGPVGLFCHDVQAMERIYLDILGFEFTQEVV
jgi:hypothetical protein